MDNTEEIMMGKDWVITVSIKNFLLTKHPILVQELQNQIQFALLAFNQKVRTLEKNVEGAIVSKPNPLSDKPEKDKEAEKAYIAVLEEEKKRREGGGGRGTL